MPHNLHFPIQLCEFCFARWFFLLKILNDINMPTKSRAGVDFSLPEGEFHYLARKDYQMGGKGKEKIEKKSVAESYLECRKLLC